MKRQRIRKAIVTALISAIPLFILTIVIEKAVERWESSSLCHKWGRYRSDLFHHGIRREVVSNCRWGPEKYKLFSNEHGLRVSSLDEKVTPGRVNAIVSGDSYAEGIGVSHALTVAGRLNNDFNVANAGTISYSPRLSSIKLTYLKELGYNPKILIHLVDLSDVVDDLVYERTSPFHASLSEADIQKEMVDSSPPSFMGYIVQLLELLQERQTAFRPWETEREYYMYRSRWFEPAFSLDEDELVHAFELLTRSTMALLKVFSRSDNYVVIYKWPAVISMNATKLARIEKFRESILTAVERSDNSYLCDLNNAITPDSVNEYFIAGDSHWNEKGHKVIYEGILECIHESSQQKSSEALTASQ
jgi:hypothetical protein